MDRSAPKPHILVFDSGVGALSIIHEIQLRLPQASITYASDNGFFPYGTKAEDALVERVHQVIAALIAHSQPDIIVVACNTASTVALPRIRRHFPQPIVGVVPAIKPAAAISHSKVIGLLATPATVARPYTHQLIQEFASNCRIITVGSSELVQLAEKKLRGEAVDLQQINPILAPFHQSDARDLDTIVLACTHFPLLKTELRSCLPHIQHWVDSGDAIARRVAFLIQEHNLDATTTTTPLTNSIFTLHSSQLEKLKPTLAQWLPGPVEIIEI
jgi:glutamate racemase